jgi:hypothetical protein
VNLILVHLIRRDVIGSTTGISGPRGAYQLFELGLTLILANIDVMLKASISAAIMDRRRDASAESIGQGEGQRLLHRKTVWPPGRISEIEIALVGPDPLQESEGEGEMRCA